MNISVKPDTLDGRYIFFACDQDGHDIFAHGLWVAPAGMSVEKARAIIDRSYCEAVALKPDEWNYDDVIGRIRAAGFKVVSPAYWIEHQAGQVTTQEIDGPGYHPIPAMAWTDDHIVEVKFDALAWFIHATDEMLLDLAASGWRGDYIADDVAEWTAAHNQELAEMFGYLVLVNKKRPNDPLGFECAVNEAAALAWLFEKKRDLLETLLGDEDYPNSSALDPYRTKEIGT